MDDRLNAESPRAGKRVRVEGRIDGFVVLRVDHNRQTVDLLSCGHVRQLLEDVPWVDLYEAQEPDSSILS